MAGDQVGKIRISYLYIVTAVVFYFLFQMTIADLSIVTIVSTCDMIVPVTIEEWPKLHNWWYSHMQKLSYYEKANRNGLNALKTWVQKCTDFEVNM